MSYIPNWDELCSEPSIMYPVFNQTINLKTKQKSYFKVFISSINIIEWHANQQVEKKLKYSLWTMINRIPGEMKQPPRSSIHWAAWQMGREGQGMQSHTASEPCRTDGQVQKHPKPWGGWEHGNGKKPKGNRFFLLWQKGPDKRMDWRSCWDECTRPWYLEKDEDAISLTQGR